jgi:zinc/manganese transport system substrate-binding protein
MKWFLLLICGWLGSQPLVSAKLNVVATLPDFANIAALIGGDNIEITSIVRGPEDAHFIDARPSFIRVLNRADVLIEGGADLEIGWLPVLVNGARNNKILADAPGHLVLAKHITLLDVPTQPVDRSMGDVHPRGNPHFWLDPDNGRIIAAKIAETFANLDSKNSESYKKNLREFETKLKQKTGEWEKRLAPFRGTKIITYHKSYDYFAKRFGFELVGQLEPKPGIEPTAVHINGLVQRGKEEAVKLMIIEPFRPRRTAEQVAKAIGARLLILPDKVSAVKEADDYFAIFEYNINRIAEALAN